MIRSCELHRELLYSFPAARPCEDERRPGVERLALEREVDPSLFARSAGVSFDTRDEDLPPDDLRVAAESPPERASWDRFRVARRDALPPDAVLLAGGEPSSAALRRAEGRRWEAGAFLDEPAPGACTASFDSSDFSESRGKLGAPDHIGSRTWSTCLRRAARAGSSASSTCSHRESRSGSSAWSISRRNVVSA